MKKPVVVFIAMAILFMVSAPLWGQTGCDYSPEDPTVKLALLGGAGAFAASLWKSRSRKQ